MIVIDATAGSGKTRLLAVIANRMRHRRVLLLAFNNLIRNELAARCPSADVHTFHSWGMSILRRYGRWKVEPNKLEQLAGTIASNTSANANIDSNNIDSIITQVRKHKTMGIPLEGEALALLQRSNNAINNANVIDYEDMIYLPVQRYMVPRYDLILVDEAQDCNLMQYRLVRKAASPVIWVGDSEQRINEWAGARSLSRIPGKRLYLPYSYRVPKAVARYIKSLIPGTKLESVSPIEGSVTHCRSVDPKPGDLILARTNAIAEQYNGITIHKAKGLEADRVWVIDPPFNETRLLFVALTRTRNKLFIVHRNAN